MAEPEPAPLIRPATDVEYESAEVQGLAKATLVGEAEGAPNFAMRRFTLDPGTTVPRHTNDVEHVQYVLTGEYVVGMAGTEYTVSAGDSLLVPAGEIHWYRNESDQLGAFLCVVPHGDDEIQLVE